MIDTPLRLEGSRVVLRDWRDADLNPFAAWLRPGHEWKRMDGPYYPLPSADAVAAMVERDRIAIASGDWPSPRTNLVVAGRGTDELTGLVTWSWESEETYWPVVGIVLYDPATWGHGLGYETLGLWSDYLFDALPAIARLDLRTWSGNGGMMRLGEKLGYTLEARFRKARIVEGAYYDGLGYGILREEWRRRYPGGFAAHLINPLP